MAEAKIAGAGTGLARAWTALRDRDWMGVLIELAVVTLGILLAFQIDQWAQDRRKALEERQFLERMWRETSEAIRENDWVIGLHAFNRQAIMRGLSARGDPLALARYRIGCGGDSMPGLGFNDTNYEELAASGRLNLVSDPELRLQLRRVAAAQADAVAQLSYARQTSIPVRQTLEPYYRLDLDGNGIRTCRIDWAALTANPLAVNAIIRAERSQALMWWKRAYTRDLLALAHNRIACDLGRSDCRAHVPLLVGRRNNTDVIPPSLASTFDATANSWNPTPD